MRNFSISSLMAILVCFFGTNINAAQTLYPLEPADRSSPRATLQTFLDDMNKAVDAYKAYHGKDAINLALRAAKCLDLESKPPAIRDTLGFESVIYLKEILDRIDIPPVDEIPDQKDIKNDKLESWTIPHTEITIALVKKGPAEGQFLFTSKTVENLEAFYNKVEELPYRPGSGGGAMRAQLISSSGLAIIRRIISYLPPWAMAFVFGQMVWQWIGLGVYFFFGAAAILLIYKCTGTGLAALDRRLDSSLERIVGGIVLPLGLILFATSGQWFILYGLHIYNLDIYLPVAIVFSTIEYTGALWLIGAILNRIAGAVIMEGGFVIGNVDAQLIRIGFNLIAFGIMVAVVVHLGGRLGLPTYSLVGGLGIGGIAVAFAGREALSNLIGTVIILLDHPFKMGDYVVFGDKIEGTVSKIGLRSTRICTWNGLLVSIPNATVANMEIINESAPFSETQIAIPVGVAYGSDISDVEETLLAIARGNEFVVPNRAPSVRFAAFGDSSVQFELLAWIVRPDIKRTAVSQMNQAIYKEFQKKGIEMPFPQRDIHIRSDT